MSDESTERAWDLFWKDRHYFCFHFLMTLDAGTVRFLLIIHHFSKAVRELFHVRLQFLHDGIRLGKLELQFQIQLTQLIVVRLLIPIQLRHG